MKAFVLNGDERSQKLTLQANIPFVELYKKARFSYMTDPATNPYEGDVDLPRNEFYQRRIDEGRVSSIKNFIRNAILGEKANKQVAVLFPTAMLLAANSERELRIGDMYDLNDIFDTDEAFYIVDGQHRLYSMRSLYEDVMQKDMFNEEDDEMVLRYLRNYRFNCTILLNFDLWEQAQVFADVNFNQKRVSTSLYYSIYGMNYSSNPSDWQRNYIFIAHSLVAFLNSHPTSPLLGGIKMLGTGKGFISQASLADSLMQNIKSPRGIWYVDPNNMEKPPVYKYMAVEILSFLSAVKKKFDKFWPVEGRHRSIICKTTGMGALLRLMAYLHLYKMPRNLHQALLNSTVSEILPEYEQFVIEFLSLIEPEKYRLFSLDGEYSGTGGKGLELRLFAEMKDLIEEPVRRIVQQQTVDINGIPVKVKIYEDKDHFFTFELSHYFQNKDQMAPYRPGSGAIAESIDHLMYKLKSYVNQVQPDASYVINSGF